MTSQKPVAGQIRRDDIYVYVVLKRDGDVNTCLLLDKNDPQAFCEVGQIYAWSDGSCHDTLICEAL